TVIFLEDHINIVSNLGERSFKYKKEFQEKIDNFLSAHNLEEIVPLSYEIQMDGLRALKQPNEGDVQEVQHMRGKYGVEFKNTEDRGFSAIALKRLEEAIIELPQDDLRLLAGFMRLSENTLGKILKSLVIDAEKGKSWIPVNDNLLVWPKIEIQQFITPYIAQAVLRNNTELAQEFRKISGWQEVKPPLHTRVLAKFFSGNNPNFNFRFNSLGPEAFLNQFSRINMGVDFQTCYQWFLLYNKEFKELAATNSTLQAKYELLEKHFSKKIEHSSE
ncbi:MAG: hypothetical protein NT116_00275, partial [Candidatus Parcubacteria bacterium]|nr:hypothetical protein [Candidatus Parcubacteria bacterium]